MSNVIVVDNLPLVPEAKYARLLEFVSKVFAGYGKIPEGGVCIPKRADLDETEGFAFIEYENKADAERAVKGLNGWALDKTHTLTALPYNDFVSFSGMAETFTPPDIAEYKPRPDLLYWLADGAARDEFLLRWADTPTAGSKTGDVHQTEVYWADPRVGPQVDYAGQRHKSPAVPGGPARVWTERHARWSPRGTFLATFHPQGVLLWGGEGFFEARRFMHVDVTDVLFSPDERIVCTWSGAVGNKKPDDAFRVWDLRSMQCLRKFKQLRLDDDAHGFAFSHDGRFLSRVTLDPVKNEELIHVYEMPTAALLDQRSIRAPGARELTWAPRRAPLLAWWTPEKENAPTSVSVIRLPSRVRGARGGPRGVSQPLHDGPPFPRPMCAGTRPPVEPLQRGRLPARVAPRRGLPRRPRAQEEEGQEVSGRQQQRTGRGAVSHLRPRPASQGRRARAQGRARLHAPDLPPARQERPRRGHGVQGARARRALRAGRRGALRRRPWRRPALHGGVLRHGRARPADADRHARG